MADLESRVLAALEERIAALEKENAELQNPSDEVETLLPKRKYFE